MAGMNSDDNGALAVQSHSSAAAAAGDASNGLLNDVQREVMNAAVAERAEKISSNHHHHQQHGSGSESGITKSKHLHGHRSADVAVKQERKSHSAVNGRPKKGGGGGRGTWGNPMDPSNYSCDIDKGDPVYESDEETYALSPLQASQSVEQFKSKVVAIINEYFASSSIDDAAIELKELHAPHYHHHFVKKLISAALDRYDRHCEMAALLLSSLYADIIAAEQMEKGFQEVAAAVDDLIVDCPHAADVISLFIARAVVDDIIPPAFLSRAAKQLPAGSAALESVKKAEARLAGPSHAEAVERVWGGSGRVTVEGARGKIAAALEELKESGDVEEAARCIGEMKLPFFHHEVVKATLLMAMEHASRSSLLLSFLRRASETGLFSSNQIEKGFARVSAYLADITLDIPNAPKDFKRIVAVGKDEKWLPASFEAQQGGEAGEGGESGEVQEEQSVTLTSFKKKAAQIVAEFFESGDEEEVGRSLEELAYPDLLHHFVKRLITTAMDRHNREREMASQLLSSLSPETLPQDQVQSALIRLLESVDDLALDIPHAAHQLALFIARAIIDDILAPHFVSELKDAFRPPSQGGTQVLAWEVVHHVDVSVNSRHAAERILRCWGAVGGAGSSASDAKDKIQILLEEYEAGGDLKEALFCLRDLNMPFFHHEVVKKALQMAMEKQNEKTLALLHECSEEGVISTSQMLKGFVRVEEALPDIVLDVPNAYSQFELFVRKAQDEKWLPHEYKILVQKEAKVEA